jgi:hypothetical protein
MRSLVWLGLGCLAVGACMVNGVLAPALARTIERDTTAPVQTDSLVHHFIWQGGAVYAVDIPFRYRNDTGRKISIVNCHGGLSITLEKRVDGVWEVFYRPVLLMCLSPPIEIEAGEVFSTMAPIYGVLPGYNAGPAFASDDLDGEYRLVWTGLVHDYDPSGSGFGDAVGPLASNPFLLVAPE